MNGKWKLMQDMKKRVSETMSKLVVIETTVSALTSLEQRKVSILNESSKLLIKTVRVTPSVSADVKLSLLDSADDLVAEEIYSNSSKDYTTGNETELYDMMDLPYIDKDNSKKVHIKIQNEGLMTANFKVKITALQLQ